jgi:hypothetical protein
MHRGPIHVNAKTVASIRARPRFAIGLSAPQHIPNNDQIQGRLSDTLGTGIRKSGVSLLALMIYAKTEKVDITFADKKQMKAEVDEYLRFYSVRKRGKQ